MNKRLLNIKEVCEYTGWGKTFARSVMKNDSHSFNIRCGNRLYVIKDKFDTYLEKCAKYRIPIK